MPIEMEDLQDYFSPKQQQQAPAMPSAGSPDLMAALLNFGVGLMQPTWGNPYVNAIGAAGEGARLSQAQDRLKREQARKDRGLDQKDEDRAQRLAIAERAQALREQGLSQKAAMDQAKLEVGMKQLDIKQQSVDIRRDRYENEQARKSIDSTVKNAVGINNLYNKEVQALTIHNTLNPTTKKPIPTIDEWLSKQNPEVARVYRGKPATNETLKDDEINPSDAPRNETERVSGTVYKTPRGPLRWIDADGKKGWIAP